MYVPVLYHVNWQLEESSAIIVGSYQRRILRHSWKKKWQSHTRAIVLAKFSSSSSSSLDQGMAKALEANFSLPQAIDQLILDHSFHRSMVLMSFGGYLLVVAMLYFHLPQNCFSFSFFLSSQNHYTNHHGSAVRLKFFSPPQTCDTFCIQLRPMMTGQKILRPFPKLVFIECVSQLTSQTCRRRSTITLKCVNMKKKIINHFSSVLCIKSGRKKKWLFSMHRQ